MSGGVRSGVLLALSLSAVSRMAFAGSGETSPPDQEARRSLDAFNREFVGACQRMDHRAGAALWAEDGVDLLPEMLPMTGKTNIAAWLDSLTPQMAGAKMLSCTIDWQDIQIHGNIAYEWGINREKIDFPPPKGRFENEGKILLILKHQRDDSWKIALESWNSNPEKVNARAPAPEKPAADAGTYDFEPAQNP